MAADSIERAELQLLSAVRGEAGGDFAISISVEDGHWLVRLRVPGRGGTGSTGDAPVSPMPGIRIGPGGGSCPRSWACNIASATGSGIAAAASGSARRGVGRPRGPKLVRNGSYGCRRNRPQGAGVHCAHEPAGTP